MSRRICARVDKALERKLEVVMQATGMSASTILVRALERYLERSRVRGGELPRHILQRTGLIGCSQTDPKLSRTYKRALSTRV